jgi:cytidine deaminase
MAMSYRDFNVGVSVLVVGPYPGNRSLVWHAFTGMNTKHAPNMRPVCAEPIAINTAYAHGFRLVVGIVVVGELREEDVGVIRTLHPCRDCRWFLHDHPIIDKNTLVLSAMPPENGGFETREIRTLGKLLDLHTRISGDDFK